MDSTPEFQTTHKQHIVPQSYLRLFATEPRPQKYMIGVGEYRESTLNKYKTSIANVGYIENYYEVYLPHRPVNYWEKRFAHDVEPYCAEILPQLLQKINAASSQEIVLTDKDKASLAKFIRAQSLRTPSWFAEGYRIINQSIRKFKANALSHIPPYYSTKGYHEYCDAVLRTKFTPDEIKDILLLSLMDSPRKEERINALLEKTWLIYVSPHYPFFLTSDNPVIRYNSSKKSLRDVDNGLKNVHSEILFPISPSVLVRIISPRILKNSSELANRKIILGHSKETADFLTYCNSFQCHQYFQHFFIPPQLYDLLCK